MAMLPCIVAEKRRWIGFFGHGVRGVFRKSDAQLNQNPASARAGSSSQYKTTIQLLRERMQDIAIDGMMREGESVHCDL